VLEWLSRATVFAEPARYEPFGLAALEAALCGCALVLGDIPSLREVWGEAATFVSPDDPDELAVAVNAALDDPGRRAAAARERARRYRPEMMADAYLDAYRAVVPAVVAR
jgi:glycogen synthase